MATMSLNLEEAVRKAQERASELGEDLASLAANARTKPPEDIASKAERDQRHDFIDAFYDSPKEAQQAFERVIAGNELQDANYLVRGAVAARTVLRIVLRRAGGSIAGYGTGFLIGNGVLLTNNHVLENAVTAGNAEAEAFFERSPMGYDLTPWRFTLQPDRLFYTSKTLDFTVVAVSDRDRTGAFPLTALGWLPLIAQVGKVMEGEWLTVVQHPEGNRKQVCVRENQLIKRDTDVLWYSTDTLGGSSGSPVFTNDWLVVALHHAGVPATKNGKWQTIDDRDYNSRTDREDRIKWIANEGIRTSRIVDTLRNDKNVGSHPMLTPIFATGVQDVDVRLPVHFASGQSLPNLLSAEVANVAADMQAITSAALAARAKPTTGAVALNLNNSSSNTPQKREASMPQQITVNLLINDDGSVSLLQGRATESALLAVEKAAAKPKKNVIDAPVIPAEHWKNAKGYNPDFLGKGPLSVNLPEITQASLIAPLKDAYGITFTKKQKDEGVLNYEGYSVVMNKDRRLAFFSAANVKWDMRPAISGRSDQWLYDDRIDRKHQLDNSYYRLNKFDRGHLTRREDMEWGDDTISAVRRANGTCTWPNCSPQHEIFNQGKSPAVELWQDLERYILEERVESGNFSAQVITGPVFGGADPTYRDIPYPVEFWKVVAAVAENGELFATAYLLSQKAVIDEHGLEAATAEPFGAYETYQRPISVIEDLTGLRFTYDNPAKPLSERDPLNTAGGRAKQVRRQTTAMESFGAPSSGALTRLEDIVLY